MKHIPIDFLKDKTNVGLQVKRFSSGVFSPANEQDMGVHRDDHYVFFFLEKGLAAINIDFTEMELPETALYYVLPSQVHQRIRCESASGWFLAVETRLIPPDCRGVFEGKLLLQQPCVLDQMKAQRTGTLLALLSDFDQSCYSGKFNEMTTHFLLQSFLVLVAGCYEGIAGQLGQVSRANELTAHFRTLLCSELRHMKSPAAYAARLHISETYLTEVIKKSTGFPASYWIHQEVIMEAKRLLYYTRMNVKEIAHELGYSDHAYFSRLFRKITGITAVTFREITLQRVS